MQYQTQNPSKHQKLPQGTMTPSKYILFLQNLLVKTVSKQEKLLIIENLCRIT